MSKVQDIMTPNPMTCYESDPVFSAVEIMKRQNVGVVPVVDRNKSCVGVVTDRDIVLQLIYNKQDPNSIKLGDIMSRDLLSCGLDDDVNQVIQLMRRRQLKRIVVLDQNKRCLGIVSEADIARNVSDQSKIGEFSKGVYSGAR